MAPDLTLPNTKEVHTEDDFTRQSSARDSGSSTMIGASFPAATDEDLNIRDSHESQGSSHSSKTLVASHRSSTELRDDRRDTTRTTNSSPTEPAYVPNQSGFGGRLAQHHGPPGIRLPTSASPTRRPEESFFDSDTASDGDDDEPVVGRASSVRVSKPRFVGGRSNVSERGVLGYGQRLTVDGRAISPSSSRYSEASEAPSFNDSFMKHGSSGPAEAFQLPGAPVSNTSAELGSWIDIIQNPVGTPSTLSNVAKQGGLSMNPITNHDRISIQRAASAPSLPYGGTLRRKVTIRPSDLIIEHSKGSTPYFRESIVTTPYPVLKEEDEDEDEGASGEGDAETLTALPVEPGIIKPTKSNNDRFPSPDRSEVLFLDLALANHPSAITTLEVKIANKAMYDDEMLFRQIRAAYRNRLVGRSRLPFCTIRGVAHAVVSQTAQHDFNANQFLQHFKSPRIGRKRKTWVIWLRHHCRQPLVIADDHSSVGKTPLLSMPSSAEKGLDEKSDSTSTVNVSFMPRALLPRIPFLNKGPSSPVHESAYLSPPAYGLEAGNGTIKIELHHEFSVWTLALFSLLVMFSSVAAVVFWTIFGVPGSRPGNTVWEASGATLANRLAWATAAQSRVLTGLVLGIVVALLGSMMELCLIAGAYLLL